MDRCIIVPPWLYDRIAADPELAAMFGVETLEKREERLAKVDWDALDESFFSVDRPVDIEGTDWSNKV